MSEQIFKTTPTFTGEQLLSTLQHHNLAEGWGLVYRGSSRPLDTIDAEIPYWWNGDSVRYADSEAPVVCADSDPLVPAFYALAPYGLREYFGKYNGGVECRVAEQASEVFHRSVGYVAVLGGEGFTPHDGAMPIGWQGRKVIRVPELRAGSAQTPLFNIKISAPDFLDLLTSDYPKSSLEFCPWRRGL